MTYGERSPVADRTAGHQRIQLLPQILIVASAVAAYFLVRGFTEAAYERALSNADRLVQFERWLGLYREPVLQATLVDSPAVTRALNTIYIWGHWPVIVVTLLWLARRRPAVYLRTRDAMLLSGSIGLIVFATFPVAPPRLAELGMTDTVTAASGAYRVLQPAVFTNQYAAMPSLHVGWNLLIALAIIAAVRGLPARHRIPARIAAVAMAAAMATAVVLTANHYLIDGLIGATLTAACWRCVGLWHRRGDRARRPERLDPLLSDPLPGDPPRPRRAGAGWRGDDLIVDVQYGSAERPGGQRINRRRPDAAWKTRDIPRQRVDEPTNGHPVVPEGLPDPGPAR